MGLAFIPVYIKLLGIEAYGLIGIFVLLQTWLSLLDLGLTPTISREMARFTGGGLDSESIHDLLRSIEIVVFVIAGMVAFGLWLASGWLSTEWLRVEKLPRQAVADALAIMGVVVGLRFVESIYRSSIIGLQRQVTLNAVISITATVRAVGAVAVLAFVSPTITAFFVWQAAVSVGSVCALGLVVHRSMPTSIRKPKLTFEPLRNVWRFAAGALAVTFLGLLLSQSDKVILSPTLTLTAFAVYSLAYTGASAVRLLAVPIDQAVYPRLTQLYQEGDEVGLAALYHRAAQYSAVLLGSAGFFVIVFGREVLTLWMRDDVLAAETYAVLWILTVGMVLNGLMNTPYYLQMAAGWPQLLAKVNVVMVVDLRATDLRVNERVRGHRRSLGVGITELGLCDWRRPTHASTTTDRATASLVHKGPCSSASGCRSDCYCAASSSFLSRPVRSPPSSFLSVALTLILAASALATSSVRQDVVGQLRFALRKA